MMHIHTIFTVVDAHKMIPIDVITTDPYSANTPILFFTVRAY